MSKAGAVYILASQRNGTLYIGVTSNLPQRISEHRSGLVDSFTKQHGVYRLVFVEHHDDIRDAIVREKQLKQWNRGWKIRLIERTNPEWKDLFDQI